MQPTNWSGLSDDAIAAELERTQAAMQQPNGTARRVAWYATFLCASILVGMLAIAWVNRSTSASPWIFALGPFFCFLPTVFFHLARELRQMENQIRALRDRIEKLERVATEQRSAPG